jgi:hypothetical protein
MRANPAFDDCWFEIRCKHAPLPRSTTRSSADQRLVIRTMARADLKAEKLDKMLVALDLHFRAP